MDKFWVSENGKVGEQAEIVNTIQRKIDGGAGLDLQIMRVGDLKWKSARDHGFKITPIVNLEAIKAEAQVIADRLGLLMPSVEEMDEDPGLYSPVWSAWLLLLRKKYPAVKIQIIYSHPDKRESQKFEAVVSL